MTSVTPKVMSGVACSSRENATEWISTDGSEIRNEQVADHPWRGGLRLTPPEPRSS